MAYIKIKDGKVENKGTLYKLIPEVSNPLGFTDEELKARGIYKPINDTNVIKSWQVLKSTDYIYNKNDDIVEEVKTVEELSLEEFKVKKYNQLKVEGTAFIYSNYSEGQQTSALLTLIDVTKAVYSLEEAEGIRNFCTKYHGIIKLTGLAIESATTYEEVETVFFRKQEIDDETMEVISDIFWGD